MLDGTPGDPHGIRELAAHWSAQASSASSAAGTLRAAKNDVSGGSLRLKGDYAPKVAEAIGELPGELEKLARGYQGCSRALGAFAERLEEAQRSNRRADDDHQLAIGQRRSAESELDALSPGWEFRARALGPLGSAVAEGLGDRSVEVRAAFARRERAQRDVDLAESLARQAAQVREEAEQDCVRDIGRALEGSGLRNRHWWDKVGSYLNNSFTTWDGFVKLCGNVSMVLGVVAIFLSGPLALIVGAVLLVTAVVAMADTLKQFRDGKIGWKELAGAAAMTVLSRYGGRVAGNAFKAARRTKVVKAFSDRAHAAANRLAKRYQLGDRARNLAHRGICTVTGHPVDVATGKVFTDAVDLELPGPLPLSFERVWFSTSTYEGPLGHGWHHSYDAALYVASDAVLYRTPDGRIVDLFPIDPGTEYYERIERLTFARDESGFRLRDADGITRRFVRSDVDESDDLATYVLSDVVSRAGHRISLSYDHGRAVRVVDSGGRQLELRYDDAGRLMELLAPDPDSPGEQFVVTRYTYDGLSNLVGVTDVLDQTFTYAYEGHLLVRETDRVGLSFYFAYDGTDESARCRRTWGDEGIYDHRLSYEAGLTTVVNSLGHGTRHEHEGGVVVRRVDEAGGETRTAYDYRQPVQVVDGLGRTTEYEYDYRGNLVLTRNPDGAVVEAVFDDHDLPVSAVDPLGGRWAWAYDDSGLLTERRDALERVWRFGYTAGLLSAMTDPAGGRTRLGHDEQGSVVTVVTPDGATSGWRRDLLGRPISAIDPLGNEQLRTFDLLGRVVRVDEPDGNVRSLSYDGEGNLLSAADQLYDVSFTYQGMGRLATRSQAGTTVGFTYDTEEQLIGVVNEQGLVYRFEHGPTGEVTVERGFDGVLRIYERDVLGRVEAVRRASGAVSRYRYDPMDRVVAVEHSDGTTERFGYRADGALALAENSDARVVFERDTLGRVTLERQDGRWVASEYDALGLRVRMRSSLGADQVIERDVMGDVTAISAGDFDARFTRDALGQELTRELPGGVRGRWHRDDLGRPIRQEVTGVAGAVRDRSYIWDVDNRLRGVVDALAGPITYEHDALGQLAAARFGDGQVELRMPDAVGNLFRSADRADRVYGPAGQLLESTDDDGRRVSYAYDPEGNLVTKRASNGEVWEYRWNAAGHLASVVRPEGSTVSFAYDALGRRVSKTFRGRTTRWVWDGNVPLHEWVEQTPEPVLATAGSPPSDGVAAAREAAPSEFLLRGPPDHGTADAPITWLFEPESFALLARVTSGGRESIVTDHLGSPVAMLDDAGALTWSGNLTTWGDLAIAVGALWHCPFRWPGQYEDPETGLYYNRFRYYDPSAGQYISQDPIGLLGHISQSYGYVQDVCTVTDFLGLVEWVFRALSRIDVGRLNEGLSIIAKDPGASASPLSHVLLGSDDNYADQFISLTRDEGLAQRWGRTNGWARVDLDIVRANAQVLDLSTSPGRLLHLGDASLALPGSALHDANRFARGSKELLAVRELPYASVARGCR